MKRRSIRSQKSSLAALAALMMLLPACQTARMPLPDALSAAERMPVSGRLGLMTRQHLRFGPYEAHQVKRSWTRGRGRGSSLATQSERRQTYSFTLREAGEDRWFVACRSALAELTIETPVIDVRPVDESVLHCNFQSLESPTTAWELVLRQQRQRPLAGTLSLNDDVLQVVGTSRIQGALPLGHTTGYDFQERGHVVGAVEVINNGAVWLRGDQDPERRSLLSAASAALLLVEDLRDPAGS